MNSGGIRADLPAGRLTYADLYRVHPFDNRLAMVALTGQELQHLLVRSLARGAGLLQVSGLRLRIACRPRPRLIAVADERGRPLAPQRRYRVALSDYLLTGDGFDAVLDAVPADRKRVFAERLVRDEVVRYLQRPAALLALLDRLARDPPLAIEGQGCAPAPRRPLPRPLCR